MGLTDKEMKKETSSYSPYDPEAGVNINLDYTLGLPDRLASGAEGRKCRLIYGLYEVSAGLA
jgi:hypothetical protein